MDRVNVNPTQHFPWWLRATTKRTLISMARTGIWTRNTPNTSPVWWISIDVVLCAFKNFYHKRTSQSAGAGISFHFQPLQRCYCENSGSPASACVIRRHYSITYTQSFHAINGLLAVGRVGILLCGRPLYITHKWMLNMRTERNKKMDLESKHVEQFFVNILRHLIHAVLSHSHI